MCSPSWMRKPVRPPSILVCENMAGFMAVRDSGLWSRFREPKKDERNWPMGNSLLGRKGLSSAVMLGDRPPLKHLLKRRPGQQSFHSLTSMTFSKPFLSGLLPTYPVLWKTEAAQIQAQTFGVVLLPRSALGRRSSDEQPQRTRLLGTWRTKNANTVSLFLKVNTNIKNFKYCVSFSYWLYIRIW